MAEEEVWTERNVRNIWHIYSARLHSTNIFYIAQYKGYESPKKKKEREKVEEKNQRKETWTYPCHSWICDCLNFFPKATISEQIALKVKYQPLQKM